MTERSYRARGRRQRMEFPGAVDGPFDEDPEAEAGGDLAGLTSDAACTIAWRVDGHEAVQVFVDPSLVDRAPAICATLEGIVTGAASVDGLVDAVQGWARGEGLSAAIHDEPRDALSAGLVAVALTPG